MDDGEPFTIPTPNNGEKFTVVELVSKLISKCLEEFKIACWCYSDGTRIGLFIHNDVVWIPAELHLSKWLEGVYTKICEAGYKVPQYTSIKNEFFTRLSDRTIRILKQTPLKIAFKNCILDWYKFLFEDKPLIDSVENVIPENIKEFENFQPNSDDFIVNYINHPLLYTINCVQEDKLEELANQLCPKTLEAFKQWVGDNWRVLFEIIGYCLYPSYDLHKAVMLIGSGANGKSTYLRLVRIILGDSNIASVPLQALITNRFMASQLYNKLANIYPDLPSEALNDVGVFKALVGEDYITADRKHKEPIRFVNYAKLIFSANQLPPVSEHTEAFYRRWVIVEFPNKFQPDPEFFEKTFTDEEIAGCILVSLYAFKFAWKRKEFTGQTGENDVKERWLRETNPVYNFIRTMEERGVIELDVDAKADRDRLYELYQKFCDEEGLRCLDKSWFVRRLESLGFSRTRSGNRFYIRGIRLKDDLTLEDSFDSNSDDYSDEDWSLDEVLGG
jgi:putative DNA primase/helicase